MTSATANTAMPKAPLMPVLAPPPAEARPTDPNRTACFAVLAEPDPGSLPRILEFFAKRGLVPVSVQAQHFEAEESLHIDVQVHTLARDESDYIARCLRAQPLVRQVLTSERQREMVPLPALNASHSRIQSAKERRRYDENDAGALHA